MEQVTFGEHSKQPALVINHRRAADVVLSEYARRFAHRCFGVDCNYRSGHDVKCTHVLLLNLIKQVLGKGQPFIAGLAHSKNASQG